MRWFVAVGLLVGLVSFGCDGRSVSMPANEEQVGSDVSPRGSLTLTGSSTVAPLAQELALLFERKHPEARIDVQTGGSGKGIADARSGLADVGMVSRSLKADESDLTAYKIAADGVAMIVHRSNEVESLSREQILAIYTGELTNWSEVGGADRPIVVVHKAEGRATLEVFLEHFQLDNATVRPDVVVGENAHAIKTVATTEGAIGYVSIGAAEAEIEQGEAIRLLPLGGVTATSEHVASGDFPMSRPLQFVVRGTPSPLARAFIDFCQSEAAHETIESQFFVPIVR